MHIVDVVTAAGTIALAAEGSAFHPPSMKDFFPPAIWFEGTPFEVNRIVLIRFLAIGLLLGFFALVIRKLAVVPSRGQSVAEMLLDFVRVNIVEESMGKEKAKRFLPLITTIFFLVLSLNLMGFIPGINMAGTATIAVPLLLALIVYVTYHAAGVKAQGLGHYVKNQIVLPGVPWPLHIILIPIEFLTKFVIQPATLTLRLTINMMVGHLLLVLCFAATWFFFFDASVGFKAFGFLTLFGGIFMTLLKTLVAFLQAYIFALLASIYINQAMAEEH
ncbi:F0F1 ATP synthase subunit A [Sediminivirga luteola]|uniref:F0F1 ATP synthase subunit A n=1 Tax=Sediminivirga luteola TaxID=1774748 RepID=UPI003BB74BAF